MSTELSPTLKAVVDGIKMSPQMRAKIVRAFYAAQDWPDENHPGTVRDFLMEYEIPVIDTPRNPVRSVGDGDEKETK